MSNSKLTHPWRISKILDHRRMKTLCAGMYNKVARDGKPVYSAGFTIDDNNITGTSSLSGLRPITLREMDRTVDRIYRGCAIKLTIIEDPMIGLFPSIPSVVEDENGDAERLAIYGLDKNDRFLLTRIGNGCKVTVVNPYYKMAMDGKRVIRVDLDNDKNSLIFHPNETIKNRCRFCGEKDAPHRCARCKDASYCNKECQLNDWKILKHKMICVSSSL